MTTLKKKLKRDKLKEAKKDLNKKVGLFHKLGNQCLTCGEKFDKTDKEMMMKWSVVVHQDQQTVRLYCPVCWTRAKNLVEEIKDGYTNTKTNV